MKRLLTFSFLFVLFFSAGAQHSLTKLWTTDTTLSTPESVLFDGANKVLYASLIDGESNTKDGKGGIAKLGLDGKIINANWVNGLNAPKGLGMNGNILYIADVDEVVLIDVAKGSIIKKIPVKGAKFLNDITISKSGVVYVSDSETGKVHSINNGNVTTYLENIKGPNGLLSTGEGLYVLASGSVQLVNDSKQIKTLAEGLDESTDGIEEVQPGEFIVSCWSGIVYYVKSNGEKQELFDTREAKINSADIGYDALNKIVYVPTFFKNGVTAYQLK